MHQLRIVENRIVIKIQKLLALVSNFLTVDLKARRVNPHGIGFNLLENHVIQSVRWNDLCGCSQICFP